MARLRKPFSRLWSTDAGLGILVVLLVFTIFVLPPLGASSAPFLSLFFDISFSLVLLSGLTAITRTRSIIVIGTVLIVLTVAGKWLDREIPGLGLHGFNLLMSVSSLILLTGLVIAQVFREGPITMYRVLGAVAVYLLLGVTWGVGYQLLSTVDPNAFTISMRSPSPLLRESEFLYFSFVTLTTVGYGDITALSPTARSLVMMEALTGQLFPAILIARLVSMELMSRSR